MLITAKIDGIFRQTLTIMGKDLRAGCAAREAINASFGFALVS
jgi:hypothetical protein